MWKIERKVDSIKGDGVDSACEDINVISGIPWCCVALTVLRLMVYYH